MSSDLWKSLYSWACPCHTTCQSPSFCRRHCCFAFIASILYPKLSLSNAIVVVSITHVLLSSSSQKKLAAVTGDLSQDSTKRKTCSFELLLALTTHPSKSRGMLQQDQQQEHTGTEQSKSTNKQRQDHSDPKGSNHQ